MKTPNLIPIRSLPDAIRWGDGWVEAYRTLHRDAQATIRQLQQRILELETDLTLERGGRWIEKHRRTT